MKLIYCYVLNIQKQMIESHVFEGVMTFSLNTLRILKVNFSQQKLELKSFIHNPFVDPEPRKKLHVTMSRGN